MRSRQAWTRITWQFWFLKRIIKLGNHAFSRLTWIPMACHIYLLTKSAFESCQIQGSLDSWEDKWECRLHCCSQTQIIQKLQISLKVEDCFSWTKRRSKHQILQSGQRESWKLWKLASLFSVLGPWSWILKMQSKCVLLHPHPFLPIFRTMINQFTWYLSAWNSWDSTD